MNWRRLTLGTIAFFALLCFAATVVASTETGTTVERPAPPGVSILSQEQEAKLKGTGEKFQFETEVNRLMKLIINSLYKTKEIFLRELISNASDALDKIRFMSLTDKAVLEDNSELKITLVADKERKTLTLTDTGIGMTKEDLKKNLGTIAKSGTADFLATFENKKNDTNLIGQFGVGFYSAFLVADTVTVVTKHNDDKQYIWESTSENDFSIIEDPRGNTLGRGTQIILHLKDDAAEYLEDTTLRDLVKRYSEFINFPIYIWTTKTETEEVAVEEDDLEDFEDDIEDVTNKDEKAKTKTVTKTVTEWQLINEHDPIWTRRPNEVDEKEYSDFYKSFTHDYQDPLSYVHFRAEGEIDFKSILFVPKNPPPTFLQNAEDLSHNIKLFVRRVFITDELSDFLPRWLSFLKGLIDSDDLPLNVSRETLQQHSILKKIKKRVISKALEMFKNLAATNEKYVDFWKTYGNSIKLGIIEDKTHAKKLTKLLRFKSSHSSNYTSLDEYVSRMRKGQPQIYYITGEDINAFPTTPFVEKLIARGYEVLYMDQPIDEYLTNNMMDYQGKKLQHVGKSGVKYGDEDDDLAEKQKMQEEEFQPLKDYLKEQLKEWVDTVRVSNQLTTSPCAVLSSEWGVSGAMERILQAQAFAQKDDFRTQMYLRQKKVFEINPEHPIIITMLEKVKAEQTDELADSVYVLFESTALASGFSVRNASDFAKKVEKVVRERLGVDLDKEAKVEVVPAPEVDKQEAQKQDEDEEVMHDEL